MSEARASPEAVVVNYYSLLFASSEAMAKKKGKFRRYIRGIVNVEKDVLSLAGKAAFVKDFPEVVSERCWVSSIDASYSISDHTPVIDAGPLLLAIAHSDYTQAEIEEWLENVDSWDESDMVQSREISRRLIRHVGILESPPSRSDSRRLDDGKKIHTKLGWYLATGQTLQLVVYNLGTTSISPTGNSRVDCRGVAHLWPQ